MNTAHINKLRDLFIQKIKDDWSEKWAKTHGDSFVFADLKSQNAFLEDLLTDIKATVNQKKSSEVAASPILISRDSLRRMLSKERQHTWQEKTRQIIANYVGYKDWDDFENKHPILEKPTIEIRKTKEQPTKPKKVFWVAGISVLILIALSTLIWQFLPFLHAKTNPKTSFKIVKMGDSSELNYPQTVSAEYDLGDLEYKEAEIVLLYESLQYPDKQTYKLDNKKGLKQFTIHTPGVKVINLLADGKLVKQVLYTVPTGNDWYGCVRIKAKELVTTPIDTGKKYYWYGQAAQTNNTKDDWLSSPNFWKNYIGLNKNKSSYPNHYLHFPDEFIHSSGKDIFSRVMFFKCNDFPVDMKDFSLSFRVKRDNILTENCLSMFVQLWDETRSQIFLQSHNLCNTRNLVFEKQQFDPLTGKFTDYDNFNKNQINYTVPEFNNWLNDHEWHLFNLNVVKGVASITIDHKKICSVDSKTDYKQLKMIRIVFDGNGYLDDIVLTNTVTNEVVFSDNFEK